jgi:hypothetical protein
VVKPLGDAAGKCCRGSSAPADGTISSCPMTLPSGKGERPGDDGAARRNYRRLYDRFIGSRDLQPPTPRIAAYLRALLDRYPEDNTPEGGDSPSAGGPLIRCASDDGPTGSAQRRPCPQRLCRSRRRARVLRLARGSGDVRDRQWRCGDPTIRSPAPWFDEEMQTHQDGKAATLPPATRTLGLGRARSPARGCSPSHYSGDGDTRVKSGERLARPIRGQAVSEQGSEVFVCAGKMARGFTGRQDS